MCLWSHCWKILEKWARIYARITRIGYHHGVTRSWHLWVFTRLVVWPKLSVHFVFSLLKPNGTIYFPYLGTQRLLSVLQYPMTHRVLHMIYCHGLLGSQVQILTYSRNTYFLTHRMCLMVSLKVCVDRFSRNIGNIWLVPFSTFYTSTYVIKMSILFYSEQDLTSFCPGG